MDEQNRMTGKDDVESNETPDVQRTARARARKNHPEQQGHDAQGAQKCPRRARPLVGMLLLVLACLGFLALLALVSILIHFIAV